MPPQDLASCPPVDLRGKIDMKRPDTLPIADVPYYQVWAARHGFVPRLSMLDLVMNEGREGIFTLMRMTQFNAQCIIHNA